jgi:hypothetical protein
MLADGPGGILFPMEMGGPIYADVIYILNNDRWAGRNIITDGDGWTHLSNI